MSKVRKAKKLRQPNVPLATGPVMPAPLTRGERTSASSVPEPSAPVFDYTQTRKDLTRIGVLAGSFIVVLIALSFFIR